MPNNKVRGTETTAEMSETARAKSRRQALANRKDKTDQEAADIAKAAERDQQQRADAAKKSTIKLYVGDIPVGKATIQSDGMIIARISSSDLGALMYQKVQERQIESFQLAPGFFVRLAGEGNDE